MSDTYFDLFLGYSAIWLIVLIFVLKLTLGANKLEKRVREIEQQQNR